ncbi:3-dehydroquinate dehydratase, type I [Polytolypa hystricis UAMH7299]|uniref:3-dehydroquinate dehydratase, type I n=1 Tax=Polytolypa hystricis (strain UAMH7299) TaxID=1447883 RepID=A0A2B7YH14_POLH7|nr:3-dehydroquinate dehydratase, type I [Polytolypa hystricis UAMH7299]
MATDIRPSDPPPSNAFASASPNGTLPHVDSSQRTVVVVFRAGQDNILETVAEVLGKAWTAVTSLSATLVGSDAVVVGISAEDLEKDQELGDKTSMILINTHCIDDGSAPEESLTSKCHYEFLYYQGPFLRRDLTRFLSLILGQVKPHEELSKKKRTNFISTTFPDVRTALPNLDILSVGSDAVEIRVDLLKEPLTDGGYSSVPSLRYVGQQLILLRQRTELPIIFTTRCTNENGKFPMGDPNLYYTYLRRAIQWGVEYIDVELWLPEEIRKRLAEEKGNSIIMSAFHDFSGTWKWTSEEAQKLFREGAKYADIVKMIAMVNTIEGNYELEYFRSIIKAMYSHPLLSAVNMGQMGQLSRALNTVFSPITHPLLPIIAAPGQLTAAEINEALHIMGQLPKRDIYAIGSFRSTPQSMFIEKCFNELGLSHNFTCIDRGPKGSMESIVKQPSFGGAYVNPPLSSSASYIPTMSDAARAIGLIDTIAVVGPDGKQELVGENATWKGIHATLTRDYVPSAYHGRAAIVISSSESDAAAAIFALRKLDIGTIYTVGFRASGPLAPGLEPFTSIQSVKRVEQPFVIVSALLAEKSLLVQPLLRHYSANGRSSPRSTRGKVFLDLATGPRKGDPLGVATRAGWTAYGAADVGAWTTVETLRLLSGQNVPFDFVRMASGRGLY